MKPRYYLYIVFMLALILLVVTSGFNTRGVQVFQITWGGNRTEVAQSVAVDPSGSIYITGYTSSFLTSGTHVFLLKLDNTGNILWQRVWGGTGSEFGRGVGVDPQGNIYVTGYTSSFGSSNDIFLLKWNSSGSLLWQKTWGGSGDDRGYGIAVNTTSIYVTGDSTSTSSNPKAILLKFEDAGSLLWQRAWGGGNGNYGRSVAVDSSGGVYATGYTLTSSNGQDVLILKFDASGVLSWQRTWGGKSDDVGYSIARDPFNNIYLSGATQSAGAGNDDAFILKLSNTGTLLWQRTWGGTNTDQAGGVSVDNLGYVYVTGLTSSYGGSAGHVFLMSINFAGNLLWQILWGGTGGMDSGLGVAAAGSGYAISTGFVSEGGSYTTSPVSGTLATPAISLASSSLVATTLNLNSATPSGSVTLVTGSTSWQGGQDAFVFNYGAPTAPTPPSGLSAIGGIGHVNLTWNAPTFNGFSSITAYKIYRGTTPTGETLLATVGNQTSYTDLAIEGGVTYYYKVKALNAIGESDFSNEASPPSPPTTPPDPPQGLTAVASTGQVRLSWLPPASNGGQPVIGYNIYRGTSSGGESLLASLGTQTFYNDTSVAGGTVYYYYVRAINIVGVSSSSNEVSAIPVSAPTPPQNLQAISSLGKIILSWNPPVSNGGSSVTGYNVYRGTSSGAESLLATLQPQLSYTDNQVNVSTTYFYKVTAFNAIGNSGFSNEASASPSSAPTGPTAPLNLVATAGINNVTLNWNPPLSDGGSPIIGYNIYRSTAPGDKTLHAALVNPTSYVDTTDIIIGVTYYYEVTAVNNADEGPLSNEVSARPFTLPSAPLNLQAFQGLNRIVLSWNAPSSDGASPITGYRVYRNSSFLMAIGNQTSYIDTSVTAGPIYLYNVSAINAAGEGPRSFQASAFASNTPVPPSPPRNLIAIGGIGTVTLTWTPPTSNGGNATTGYEIWEGISSGMETHLVTIGNVTTYVHSNLIGGTPHYYFVRAINVNGFSAPSNEAHATPTSSPTEPLNLVASGGVGSVTLSWATPSSSGGSAIMGYKIYRGTSSGGETLLDTINDGNQLSYVDSAVTAGVTHYYKVTAFNIIGESSFSNEANAASSPPTTTPDPPTNLSASAGVNTVTLTWTPPADNGGSPIIQYQIWRGTSAGAETLLITVGNVTSYVDTTAAAGSAYHYYVKALNAVGPSSPSNEVSATPQAPATAPSMPENLSATESQGTVSLSWGPPSSDGGAAIIEYRIYRGTSAGTGILLDIVLSNVRSYADSAVTGGVTYYYRITAINSAGESAYSNEVSVTVPPGFPIIPVAIAALIIVAVASLGIIFWRRRVSQRLMMPP